jgi:hypothetical protein
MNENGSIFKEKTPEQILAIERLKPSIDKIRLAANPLGKTVERYLLDRKYDPCVAYEIHKIAEDLLLIEPIEHVEKVEKVATKKPPKRKFSFFNEFFLDVIKWGLILIIAGAVFYVVSPKYESTTLFDTPARFNKLTGQLDFLSGGIWERITTN